MRSLKEVGIYQAREVRLNMLLSYIMGNVGSSVFGTKSQDILVSQRCESAIENRQSAPLYSVCGVHLNGITRELLGRSSHNMVTQKRQKGKDKTLMQP